MSISSNMTLGGMAITHAFAADKQPMAILIDHLKDQGTVPPPAKKRPV